MCVSGHKSESNILSYSKRLTEEKQREIFYTLSSATVSTLDSILESNQLLRVEFQVRWPRTVAPVRQFNAKFRLTKPRDSKFSYGGISGSTCYDQL